MKLKKNFKQNRNNKSSRDKQQKSLENSQKNTKNQSLLKIINTYKNIFKIKKMNLKEN